MDRYNKVLIASDGESALLMLNGAIIPSENFSLLLTSLIGLQHQLNIRLKLMIL